MKTTFSVQNDVTTSINTLSRLVSALWVRLFLIDPRQNRDEAAPIASLFGHRRYHAWNPTKLSSPPPPPQEYNTKAGYTQMRHTRTNIMGLCWARWLFVRAREDRFPLRCYHKSTTTPDERATFKPTGMSSEPMAKSVRRTVATLRGVTTTKCKPVSSFPCETQPGRRKPGTYRSLRPTIAEMRGRRAIPMT